MVLNGTTPIAIYDNLSQNNGTTTSMNGNIIDDRMVHTYQDHANDNEGPHLLQQLILDSTKARHGAEHAFPVKLHYMLSKIPEDGLSHVVSWQPHGRCFLVHDQKEFVERVLKCWFRQSKFASFQRQLNLYGFRRLTTGRDKGGYYHEFFLRGKPLLAHRIQRTKVKGTGTRKPSSPETEPNFYLMQYLSTGGDTKKPAQVFDPFASLTLQRLLPATLNVELQANQPPQQSGAARIQQQSVQSQPQSFMPIPVSNNGTSATSITQRDTTADLGSVEPGLAFLAPLTSYFNVNSPTEPVRATEASAPVVSNENNALRNYEAILTVMALGGNLAN